MKGNIIDIYEVRKYFVEDSKMEELIKWLEENGSPISSVRSYDLYIKNRNKV